MNPDVKKAGNSDEGFAWFKSIKADQSDQLIAITNKGELRVSDGIIGNASLTVAKAATTTLINSGSNYSGPTNVLSEGLLVAISENALSAKSDHTISGSLDLGGQTQRVKSLTLDGGSVSQGSLIASNGFTTRGGNIYANLKGLKGLTVESGSTTLWGSNSYLGDTLVTKGTLKTGQSNVFSSNSATVIGENGILDFSGSEQTIKSVSLDGGVIQNGSLDSSGGITSFQSP